MKKIGDNAPMSVALSIFRDAKLDELVNVYSKAPDTERPRPTTYPAFISYRAAEA